MTVHTTGCKLASWSAFGRDAIVLSYPQTSAVQICICETRDLSIALNWLVKYAVSSGIIDIVYRVGLNKGLTFSPPPRRLYFLSASVCLLVSSSSRITQKMQNRNPVEGLGITWGGTFYICERIQTNGWIQDYHIKDYNTSDVEMKLYLQQNDNLHYTDFLKTIHLSKKKKKAEWFWYG